MIIKHMPCCHLSIMWLICLIVILNCICLSGQSFWKNNYKKADKIASKTEKTIDIKTLSNNLTKYLPDTIDKYRAIFTWIATNISYDVKGVDEPDNTNTKPEDVLTKGSSVCEGFSNLFHALCDQSGLSCQTISGWTKNFPSKINEPFTKQPTHAWNSIKLNNQWYLCDVTWASGYLSEEDKKFVKEFNDLYFCTPPQVFALNHFPQDEQWFLSNILSKEYFINLPHFYSFSLANNIKITHPENGIITFKKNEKIKFIFTIDIPIYNILVKASETNVNQPIQFTQIEKEIIFEYRFDRPSPYLNIYLNYQGALVYKMQ